MSHTKDTRLIRDKLTLIRPMEFSIKFDTVKPGWFLILYIEGSQVMISQNIPIVFLSVKIIFISNSADPDGNAALCGMSSESSLFAKVPAGDKNSTHQRVCTGRVLSEE